MTMGNLNFCSRQAWDDLLHTFFEKARQEASGDLACNCWSNRANKMAEEQPIAQSASHLYLPVVQYDNHPFGMTGSTIFVSKTTLHKDAQAGVSQFFLP